MSVYLMGFEKHQGNWRN